jgi:hypothetical protein
MAVYFHGPNIFVVWTSSSNLLVYAPVQDGVSRAEMSHCDIDLRCQYLTETDMDFYAMSWARLSICNTLYQD